MHPAATLQSTIPPPAAAQPDLRFLVARPAHLIALGFGSGLPRRGPGTWGTLFAWLSFVALDGWLTDVAWGLLIAAGLAIGTWAAQRTCAALGRADSGHVVIDEIVAFWLVLLLLPDGAEPVWLWQAAAFLLFRAFDIAKPPPIRYFDARYKSGFGVMLDDLIAAFLTLLVFALVIRVF